MFGSKPTESMQASDPFAAFLKARPSVDPSAKKPLQFSLGLGKAMMAVAPPPTAFGDVHDGPSLTGEGNDVYATFLADRPEHPIQEAERLKLDVLRTKKQLLELALETEKKAANGVFTEEEVARLRRLRTAERYLYHPDRIFELQSGGGSLVSEVGSRTPAELDPDLHKLQVPDDIAERTSDVASTAARIGTPSKQMDMTRCRSLPDGLGGARSGSAMPTGGAAGSRPGSGGSRPSSKGSATLQAAGGMATGGMSRTASAGGMGRTATSGGMGLGSTVDAMNLTRMPEVAGSSAGSTKLPYDPARDHLMNGWWSKTRCFNIQIGKDSLSARRQTLGTSGGCLVFGNGRMPLYKGAHLLLKGYYSVFKIHAMDTARLPKGGGTPGQGLALAVGISRLSPAEPRLSGSTCPLYGYEVPGSVVVGYGAHLIDEGKWYKQPWDTNTLQIGDKVGLFVSQEGDLVIFHNDVQVLRVQTSLNEGAFKGATRNYYAMVDLSGHCSELMLLPKAEPPNVPLQVKDPIERKLA